VSGTKKGMGLVPGGAGAAAAAALRAAGPRGAPRPRRRCSSSGGRRPSSTTWPEAVRIPRQPGGPLTHRPGPLRRVPRVPGAHLPRVHQDLTREVVAGYSLLYTWEGADRRPGRAAHGHLTSSREPGTEATGSTPRSPASATTGTFGPGHHRRQGVGDRPFRGGGGAAGEGFRPDVTLYWPSARRGSRRDRGRGRPGRLLAARGVRLDFVSTRGHGHHRLPAGLKAPLALVGLARRAT